ncbi:unnamed protein product [Callosobruchus maculatus]|uniref:Uncharacterized protein n=1 Tax=Callosobruchus maculatus TaxID=64391 RepID=A0A653CRT1_CALMS|nr:unnamed protein product [Callosobruchus maculatus]
MFEIQCPNFPKLKLSVYSLERELKRIDKHVDLINKLKDRTIVILEEKKLNFRKYITIPKIYEEVKNEERRLVPVTVIERIISIIDKDISGIQNKYDLIIGDLRDMKENIEERIKIVEQTELIMNLLHYRMYEIRYDFTMKLNQLTQQKADLKTGMMLKETESQAAFKIIETEKEITECQNNFSNLLLLLEAEKAIIEDKKYSLEDVKNVIALEDIEAVMDKFTEMQTEGWKTRAVDNISVLSAAKGLKITTTGLLITESGRQITYQEAREQKLLDNINIFDFVYEQEKKSSVDLMSVESAGESKSSGDSSQMTSEDVNYLKENLGIPLTLALAEITAVQPKDPIHYLGHWLFKYRYNQEILVTHSGRRVPELTALPVSSKAMIASCQGADV